MANNFMEEIYGEDYIEHHGVKGMKWGVRRARERSIAKRHESSLNRTRERLEDSVYSGKINKFEKDRRYSNAWMSAHYAARRDMSRADAKAYSDAAKTTSSSRKAAKYEKKAKKFKEKAHKFDRESVKYKKVSDLTNNTYDTKLSAGEKLAVSFLSQDTANHYLVSRSRNSVAASAGEAIVRTYFNERNYAI